MSEILAPKNHKEITVAILPFTFFSEEDLSNPLLFGFTDDLTSNLSLFTGLGVISQFSTQNLTTSDTDAIEKLGADYLVMGSFRKLTDNLRISIQLIRSIDKKLVFAKQYDQATKLLLDTLDDITQQIVSTLQRQINYDLLSFSYKKNEVELEVYESWLQGMEALKKATIKDDLKARDFFNAALQKDKNYARAYTGLSLSFFNEMSCRLWRKWDESLKNAKKFALKALELDENDYLSLSVLGRIYLYFDEFEKAEHCLRKSIRMNPNDAKNLLRVSFSLVYLGYANEAEKLYEKAMALNPMHSEAYFAYASFIYFELGEYEKSLHAAQKVDIDMVWVDFFAYKAAAYYYLKQYDKMKACWEQYLAMFNKHVQENHKQDDLEALSWHVNINPYKGKTNLELFWKYINDNEISDSRNAEEGNHIQLENAFLKKAEMWELIFEGQQVLLKDAKGYHDITKLLAEPEKEFHCTELMGAILSDGKGTKVIDEKAKKEYQKRITDLQAEIAEAEEMNNTIYLQTLRDEYETLIDYLSKSMGLAGKTREINSTSDKVRSAVTWRIRNAIKKIEKVHPQLAKHLNVSVKTGSFCSYKPEHNQYWRI